MSSQLTFTDAWYMPSTALKMTRTPGSSLANGTIGTRHISGTHRHGELEGCTKWGRRSSTWDHTPAGGEGRGVAIRQQETERVTTPDKRQSWRKDFFCSVKNLRLCPKGNEGDQSEEFYRRKTNITIYLGFCLSFVSLLPVLFCFVCLFVLRICLCISVFCLHL